MRCIRASFGVEICVYLELDGQLVGQCYCACCFLQHMVVRQATAVESRRWVHWAVITIARRCRPAFPHCWWSIVPGRSCMLNYWFLSGHGSAALRWPRAIAITATWRANGSRPPVLPPIFIGRRVSVCVWLTVTPYSCIMTPSIHSQCRITVSHRIHSYVIRDYSYLHQLLPVARFFNFRSGYFRLTGCYC